jgi:hypothetical protein
MEHGLGKADLIMGVSGFAAIALKVLENVACVVRNTVLPPGVEAAWLPFQLPRTEFLYDDYGTDDYSIDGPSEPYDARAGLTASTIRIGAAYKF